jgi:hypothetical protein
VLGSLHTAARGCYFGARVQANSIYFLRQIPYIRDGAIRARNFLFRVPVVRTMGALRQRVIREALTLRIMSHRPVSNSGWQPDRLSI